MSEARQYRLLKVLGRGGMAEVFEGLAVGEGFERRVAVKRMLVGFEQDPSFGRMFLDEARIASRLHHANIVSILDSGVASGLPFQILEFIDGLDLGHLLELGMQAGTPLPLELALHLTTEVAHALEYAHQAVDPQGAPLGIVHRDVSPSNILVAWSGDVKLTDFGIAFAQGRLERTQVGVVKGKASYMAPEQVLGGGIDGRVDVFALGCVLHALVTGNSPLVAQDARMALLGGKELELAPSLPEDVRAIVARATRRSREERYDNAAAMADALGRALAPRITQDPRTLLKAWLAPLRGPAEPVRGKFDDLLNGGVEQQLLIAGVDEKDQQFEARTLSERRPVLSAEPLSETVPSMRRQLNRGLIGGLLGVVVVAAVWWGMSASVPRPAVGGPSGPVVVDGPTPDAGPNTPGVFLPSDSDAGPTIVARLLLSDSDAGAVVSITPDAGPRRKLDAGHHPPPPPPPPETSALLSSGVVTIGGEGASRAEIFVDGTSKGFAPRQFELPVGRHTFELRRHDGQRVGPTSFAVTPLHTVSNPMVWEVP